MRHPLHPALVHFPVACWSLTTAADFASLVWGEPAWRFAAIVLLVGLAMSIPAMLAGFFELVRVAPDSPAIKDVNRHMIAVLCALSCYTVSLFLRLHGTTLIAPGSLALGFSALGFVFLGLAGWLGGKLVYGHRLGASSATD